MPTHQLPIRNTQRNQADPSGTGSRNISGPHPLYINTVTPQDTPVSPDCFAIVDRELTEGGYEYKRGNVHMS